MLRRTPPLDLTRAVQRLQRARVSPAPVAERPKRSGRRRRLWELDARALDLVLGVGLPHEALCRLARRVLRSEPRAHGHALHAGLVTECRRRGPMAEALHEELDRRHAAALRQAAAVSGSEALAGWWQACVGRNELPGALWATLSHAHCTAELQQRVLGEVQMLQFQAGQAARVELARFAALIDENAVLARALGQAQQRCTALMAEHASERQAWQAERATLCGRLQGFEQALQRAGAANALVTPAALPSTREERRAAHVPKPPHRPALSLASASASASAPAPVAAPQVELPAATVSQPGAALEQRKVLCVGGRTASVPVYRRLVEARGGRFLHHDGGEEDKLGQLDATLAAADLVICQAGCVSHNAYWRVKDHCKRTGKRCVFVETPSAAGLQRALAQISE